MKFKTVLLGLISTQSVVGKYTSFDDNTFVKGIKENYWFIKHYTKWCGYSKALLPKWKKAYTELKHKEDDGFYFGEVDCDNGVKTCNNNNITGYPTLLLFKQGVFLKEYLGEHDLKSITEFVEEFAPSKTPADTKPVVIAPAVPVISKDDQEFYDKVQSQRSTLPLFKGEVLDLVPSKFNESIKAIFSGTWVVEFYSPQCPHCQAFKPDYEQLAIKTKDQVNLARVDCIEFQTFCTEHNVEGVPDLRIFKGGNQTQTYRESRDLKIISKYMKKFYLPNFKSADQNLIKAKQELSSKSTPSKPFLVLSTPSVVTQFNNTQKIRNYLEGVDIQTEFFISEDGFSNLDKSVKFNDFSFKAIHGLKELTYSNSIISDKESNFGLRTWVSMNQLPLSFKLTSQKLKDIDSAQFQIVIGIYNKKWTSALPLLERTLLETNLEYQEHFDFKSATNTTLPLLFCYFPNDIEHEDSKEMFETLNISLDQLKEISNDKNLDFILLDPNHKKFNLLSKTNPFKSFKLGETSSLYRSILESQLAIHTGEPLLIKKPSGSSMYLVLGVMALLLFWYYLRNKKKRAEEMVQYNKLI